MKDRADSPESPCAVWLGNQVNLSWTWISLNLHFPVTATGVGLVTWFCVSRFSLFHLFSVSGEKWPFPLEDAIKSAPHPVKENQIEGGRQERDWRATKKVPWWSIFSTCCGLFSKTAGIWGWTGVPGGPRNGSGDAWMQLQIDWSTWGKGYSIFKEFSRFHQGESQLGAVS